jgi:hypothetical protein
MIHPTTESALKSIKQTADSNLVDVVGGTAIVTDWMKELQNQYLAGNRRPETIILILERKGVSYSGAIYLTKEHFKGRYK